MSLHINRFIDRIKSQESRAQRELVMSMNEARDLHADITRLLLQLTDLQDQLQQARSEKTETITVQVDGGTF